jgi:hypothetical protein
MRICGLKKNGSAGQPRKLFVISTGACERRQHCSLISTRDGAACAHLLMYSLSALESEVFTSKPSERSSSSIRSVGTRNNISPANICRWDKKFTMERTLLNSIVFGVFVMPARGHVTQRPKIFDAYDALRDVEIETPPPKAPLPFQRELLTCLTTDASCSNKMCNDGGCYEASGGANCNDGTPPQTLCSSDCTSCEVSYAPTNSPAPTIEVVNYWTKTCDTKAEKPCSPNW